MRVWISIAVCVRVCCACITNDTLLSTVDSAEESDAPDIDQLFRAVM